MSYTYLLEGGGGILGGMLCGNTCVCSVEIEPYPRKILLQRQRDGILPPFPVWDDVCTFDGNPWRGHVDIICGGFPCQDISAAGKGAGITGERSGLWKEFARIIGEVRPNYVLVENSPMLTLRGLGVVLGDLAALGYDAQWCVLGAVDAGAPHKRDRIWIVANCFGYRRNDRRNNNRQHDRSELNTSNEHPEILAYTESRKDFGRRRGDVDDTPCSREGCNTSFNACREDVADTKSKRCGEERGVRFTESQERTRSGCENVSNPLCDGSQRSRKDRDVAGQTGLRSGKRSDEEQCVCNATSARLQNGRGAQVGEPGAIEELKRSGCVDVSDTEGTGSQRLHETGCDGQSSSERVYAEPTGACSGSGTWWAVEPDVGRVAHGVASRVDRLKAIGNGQVPRVVATAWEILSGVK